MEWLGPWDKCGHPCVWMCVCMGGIHCSCVCVFICMFGWEVFFVHVCVHMCVWTGGIHYSCVCVCSYACLGGRYSLLSSYTPMNMCMMSEVYVWYLQWLSALYLWDRMEWLSQRMELLALSRLRVQWASGTLLCLPLASEHWSANSTGRKGFLAFWVGAWDPNTGPQVPVSTSPTEPSPSPKPHFWKCLALILETYDNTFWVNSKGSILANSKISNFALVFFINLFPQIHCEWARVKQEIATIHCSYWGCMTCGTQELGVLVLVGFFFLNVK